MTLAEFLRQLDPVVKDMDAKIKTDQWLHKGQRFRKVEVIWVTPINPDVTLIELSVVTEQR